MHARGESFQESRMREIRMSGLMRGRATALPTLPVKSLKNIKRRGAKARRMLAIEDEICDDGELVFVLTAVLTDGEPELEITDLGEKS